MSELKGFMAPRTPSGASAIIPEMPWYYSGTLLTVEYLTDPANVRAILPAELELADEQPGAVAFIWADWQSCSSDKAELLDPIRSQYLEAFVVVRCKYQGVTYSRCVAIWVTKDFAIARGWFQGYPKKLGSAHVTRIFNRGQATPRLEPGAQLGATLSAYDHRLASAVVTLRGPVDQNGFGPYHHR
jgi:acetoacetate decarboxylase